MCLTIPKQVISFKGGIAKLKSGSDTESVPSILTSLKKGDWVLTQNGVITNKINSNKASEILKIIAAHKTQ